MLSAMDWIIMGVYFVFVLGIGVVLKRFVRISTDFFLAGRSIPAWVAGLAFLSANLGAQEVIGMGASGAKYGIDEDLVGLVYSLTERPKEQHLSWYQRPVTLAVVVLAATAVLNFIFR